MVDPRKYRTSFQVFYALEVYLGLSWREHVLSKKIGSISNGISDSKGGASSHFLSSDSYP